jgi:UDP-2-acetamido-2,6-beta-L-arabino-hexul-4-ose reductase
MLSIGITGQPGFMGTHLFNRLNLEPEIFSLNPFEDSFFEDQDVLNNWIKNCDVVLHLAALNRHNQPDEIYHTNIRLVEQLIDSLKATDSKPHLLFASSTQEERDNPYGRSKLEGRKRLAAWADKVGATFTGLIIPNVYGPFGNPYYNSVIATFCHQITHGEEPKIDVDGHLKLIYINELTEIIRSCILERRAGRQYKVPHTAEKKVSEILALLEIFKSDYIDKGLIPRLKNSFELNLFNTFRLYMDIATHYPVALKENSDERGSFVETLRSGIGGQISFSTTKPGIVRGNHFHTRKIERFVVLKGEALIQLRRIGEDKIIEYRVSGNNPSFVDMPVWYTHNLQNVGQEDLYTLFWINEFYDPDDPDTHFENV